MPLLEFGTVGEGEDVAYRATAYVEPVQEGPPLHLSEVTGGDLLGKEIGSGFKTIEVLGGDQSMKPIMSMAPGFRFGGELLAEGIGGQAEFQPWSPVRLIGPIAEEDKGARAPAKRFPGKPRRLKVLGFIVRAKSISLRFPRQ